MDAVDAPPVVGLEHVHRHEAAKEIVPRHPERAVPCVYGNGVRVVAGNEMRFDGEIVRKLNKSPAHPPLLDLVVGPSSSARSCGVHSGEPGPKLSGVRRGGWSAAVQHQEDI